MLNLKFRSCNRSLIIAPQHNKKKLLVHTQTQFDPAQKKQYPSPSATLLTAPAQVMGESEVTHECPAFAANAGGLYPLSA
jgi:hypothetical protein